MSDLRRQLAELRQAVDALMPNKDAATQIREYFAAPAFDALRETIVERVLADGSYSFRCLQPDDESADHPSRFIAMWTGHHWNGHARIETASQLLVYRLRYLRDWRQHVNAANGRESIETLAERHADALAQRPGAPEPQSDSLTPTPVAPSPSPAIAEDVSDAEREAEIARIRREIARIQAQLDAPTIAPPAQPVEPMPEPARFFGGSASPFSQLDRRRF